MCGLQLIMVPEELSFNGSLKLQQWWAKKYPDFLTKAIIAIKIIIIASAIVAIFIE